MLVLSRKKHQRIMVGDQIEIHVLEIRGGALRLGFNAPGEVAIHRQEVYEKVNQQASAQLSRSATTHPKRLAAS